MTLRPGKRGEKLRIVIELRGPQTPAKYDKFKRDLDRLLKPYRAKVVEKRKPGK